MKTRTIAALIALLLLALAGCASAQEPEAKSRSLSPYFFVKDAESAPGFFPLQSTKVTADISGVIAKVTVAQVYENRGELPLNARYIFPASTRAAVHGMTMKVGDDIVKARIQEKKTARATFAKARKQGKSASLLEQQRPNVFSMDVANVMPGDIVEIELTYSELLVPREGVYSFVYPTVVGPRYAGAAEAAEPGKHSWVGNPYLKEGKKTTSKFDIRVDISTGIPLQELSCRSHHTDFTFLDDSTARVSLAGSDTKSPDRDFILKYRLSGDEIQSGLLTYQGESENFFLLMMEPPKRVAPEIIPPRDYIFVVDVSGSMHGFPLNTAKILLEDLIGNLRPTDTFNLLLFSGGSRLMSSEPLPATRANLDEAVRILTRQRGGGGTETYAALARAFSLPREENVARSIVLVTDGYIAGERDLFSLIAKNLNNTNVFAFGIGSSVNRYLIEGVAKAGMAEPFIVTDSADAPGAAARFREYIASPVLTDIEISHQGIDLHDLEPQLLPDLFSRRPLLVVGKFEGGPRGSITITGRTASGLYEKSFAFPEADSTDACSALPYLWARTRLARISDDRVTEPGPEIDQEILKLGLTYHLLSEKTSFVAVHEKVRNPGGEAKDATQPLPLPKGVSNLAMGGACHSAPEPGLLGLVLLLAALLSARALWNSRKRHQA